MQNEQEKEKEKKKRNSAKINAIAKHYILLSGKSNDEIFNIIWFALGISDTTIIKKG